MKMLTTFGRTVGLNPDDKLIIDGTKAVMVEDYDIFGGMPLALYNDNGETKVVSYKYLADKTLPLNVKPYGLAYFNKDQYANETCSMDGTYGSGKGSVIVLGRVSVGANTFIVNDSTIKVFGFDTTKAYVAGEPLYIDLDAASPSFGKITNVLVSDAQDPACNTNTFVGTVIAFYADSNAPTLEILLKL